MRFFVDTEFVFECDTGGGHVAPMSVGIVADDARELYAVNANWSDFVGRIPPFVNERVVPALVLPDDVSHLYVHGELATIARDLRAFIGDNVPEFWGDYAAFDYVVLSIIMGGFDAWPKGWPMVIRDLQETPAGREASGSVASLKPHNALYDARAVRGAWYLANEPVINGEGGW